MNYLHVHVHMYVHDCMYSSNCIVPQPAADVPVRVDADVEDGVLRVQRSIVHNAVAATTSSTPTLAAVKTL